MDQVPSEGLLRAILSKCGQTLSEAFANLDLLGPAGGVIHHAKRSLANARILLPPEDGEGYWELTRVGTDIYIVVADVTYRNPRDELISGEGLTNFLFKISGDMILGVDASEPLHWNRPSLVLWSQPPGISIRERLAAKTRERYVAICVRPKFLLEHLLVSGSSIPEALRPFVSNRREELCYCQRPLDAQTFELVTRLVNNPYAGALSLVHTEALALELLCAAVGKLIHSPGAPIEQYTAHELRCLHAARDMLMHQFSPVPTITHIARAVGISQSRLTSGFRSLFGQTIFDFSLHCRMMRALTLIRDQGWSVERTSEAVGYAHATSFATAFRRYFDLRPIELRHNKHGRPSRDVLRPLKRT